MRILWGSGLDGLSVLETSLIKGSSIRGPSIQRLVLERSLWAPR